MRNAIFPVILIGLLAGVLLFAGCAKKATEQELPPRVDTAAPTETTDVSRQPAPLAVGSQGVQSGPVADQQSVAGLSRLYFAYNRITSYNVCYTKLLRISATRSSFSTAAKPSNKPWRNNFV